MNVTREQIIARFTQESKGLSSAEKKNLLREILQETVLCHMKEVNLFDEMAFHGGTSLRLLHRIDRFSEDLDMSLLKANESFDLPTRMESLKKSLSESKIELEFQNKCKLGNPIKVFYINDTALLNQFKDDIGGVIDGEKVKIKFELDILPPDHQEFKLAEIKSTFSAKINAHNLETCMGQKIHAVLCRAQAYGMDIIKGRDLYDLEWYLSKKIKPNLKNLSACLNRIGPWQGLGLDVDHAWIVNEVSHSLKTKNFEAILADVRPLINVKEFERLKKEWTLNYFSISIGSLSL